MPNRLRRKLFNRPISVSHSLYSCIDKACEVATGPDTAILNNLVLDHRVTAAREAAFLDFCMKNGVASAEPLLGLLKKYEEREVQLKGVSPVTLPAYLREENAANLLHGNLDFRTELLDPSTRLVTVKTSRDIHAGLRRRLGLRYGSDRVDPANPSALLDVFDEVSRAEQGTLLRESLVEALNSPRGDNSTPVPDPGCVWATFEADLLPFLERGPACWFEFLGLKKHRGEGLALVIAYRVSDTGALARPTQIDAGLYSSHMPPLPVPDFVSSTLAWGTFCGRMGVREMLLHQQVVENDRLSVIHWQRYRFDADGPSVEELRSARLRRFRFWSRQNAAHRAIVREWLRT